MIKKPAKDITEFFRQAGRISGKLGGKRSLQTLSAEQRSERAKKTEAASAQVQRSGALQRLPPVGPHLEAPPGPIPRSQALILADEILNRLNAYPRKGSRTRKNFYRRDLNWMADVLMRVEAGERDPLRPTGQ